MNGQTEGYFTQAVEYLKDMIANQATIFARSPVPGIQFNAAVASPAFGTDDVGLFHVPYRTIMVSLLLHLDGNDLATGLALENMLEGPRSDLR